MVSERTSRRVFFGISSLLFVGSAAATIVWCSFMTTTAEMPMPGGWTMSMAWMGMPGHTWLFNAFSFLGMWIVMMVAMMVPSLVPMLQRYRQAVDCSCQKRGLTAIEMQHPEVARAAPIAAGVVVLLAGAIQFTGWKARHLACCRQAPGRDRMLPAGAGTAWRHGLFLGFHCSLCCAGLMVILLVIGIMNLRAMAVVGIAITIERLAPAGELVARAIGAVVVATGLFLIARAVGL